MTIQVNVQIRVSGTISGVETVIQLVTSLPNATTTVRHLHRDPATNRAHAYADIAPTPIADADADSSATTR
ncbi:hypothetical protein [Nocardia tengchongensis]|uniref:hypothetical protein n=1 Tax=Nocardia tengchongensis TaxID=2055889 RepID=UPI00365244B7